MAFINGKGKGKGKGKWEIENEDTEALERVCYKDSTEEANHRRL